MSELSGRFLNLDITDDIFKGIRYFVTGEVHEKIEILLKSGGAEHQNYFSDYVTHLIVGKNPEENDVADANDVYEIPAVTPQWILICASLKKRLDCKPYLFSIDPKLFSWQIFCFSKVSEDRNNLWGLITFNGGVVHTKLTKMCNFLVTGVTDSPKFIKAESLGSENIKIVTPDWIWEAVRTKSLPDPALFHPKLINWPRPVKPTEPTTAITGFEPDTPESKEKIEEKAIMDSTQALLEKLKQRMPWNQPPATTSSSSDPIAPPNVIAPSFLSKIQNNQELPALKHPRPQISSLQSSPAVSSFASTGTQSPSHVPRSIVHHTPNNQNQQSVLQHSPLNISRLIGQPQTTRPTSLQQLRGQLNTSQIHQQLLQQRIQQQNQQSIIQRTSTGQINVNQQLLHQHLSQGQRQSLQNQLMSQQGLLNQQQGLANQAQGLNLLNQVQQSQTRLIESQTQQNSMIGQQDQSSQQFNQQNQLNNQQNQLIQQNQMNNPQNLLNNQQTQLGNQQNQLNNQQNSLLNQQNQLTQTSSPNQVIRSPQQSQNQLLSPQQIQNQVMSHQQQQNQVNQLQQQSQLMQQQANHFLNQPQPQNQLNQQQPQNQLNQQQPQNQLNQQQDRASQLVNQQQDRVNQLVNQQQDRVNQLVNQQDRVNQLVNQQQDRVNQLVNQQQDRTNQLLNQQQDRANQLLNQDRTNQLVNQQDRANQLLNQQERANQLLNQQERANQLLNQQDRANQLLNQQQNQNQLNQQHNQSNQMLRQHQNPNDLQNQLLGQLSPQNQMIGSQQIQNQQNPQLIQQNQQLIQQNQSIQQNQPSQQNQQLIQHSQQSQQNQAMTQLNQSRVSQQSPILNQNQLVNHQNQQILNRTNQHQQNQDNLLTVSPNHHLSQLSPQQLQQLQQLKREQQLLNQGQNQLAVLGQQNIGLNQQSIGLNQQNLGLNQQNLGLNQQNIVNQGHNQQLLNQNQQLLGQNQQMQINQQLIQNRVIQQQNLQQISQGQNFGQHLINQKPQLFGQQQITTSPHQQMIQNQPNLTSQQQFVNQNQFEVIQQQKLNQGGGQGQLNQQSISHMSVQALNQQLNSQNLGQQLNQQLLQQNQQTGLTQGNLNQQNLNPGMGMDQGMNQNIGILNQQPVTLNQQGGLNLQALNQGSNQQLNQINPGMNQQVIRAQFPQQVLVSQGQQGGPQRAQLNQQIWGQQQQAGAPIQGQQIIRHPVNVAVQQSPTGGGVGPRIQWPPGQQPAIPQRQFIQLDAHTHNQLQKMPPDQQALFVAKLQQKQRQLQLAKQVQQRGGGHILIRGNVPPGLTAQQQVQWLQQQAKQQGIVLPPNIQQNLTPGTITAQQGTPAAVVPPHAPGLSPINQNAGQAQQFVGDQPTAQQLQLRQYRSGLQQLHLQREQAQKNVLAQGALPPQAVVRPPLGQPPTADSTTNPQVQVNPKTKTALANMLSIKLQSGGTIGTPTRPEGLPEPSAAGTLRMMTAQHNAAINSKPQEIIALQQRRTISGPNGEIIKPPGVPALSLTPQSEPPKLQYSQKPPVPVQHRVGPFYGHNPNLKLPPDLFLLGCIFVVVEVEEYLEERLPGWQQQIEKYGGEVEKQYCSKVTHVLCETQRHGVVMQALRDLKRCVTIRWLSDVIKRKQVLPPWTALHLPQIYLDITPASKHLISISGFEGNIRQVVKQMIQYTGAKCTTYFSRHNTLLICSKAEGKKFNHAKKWGTPVVNVQWLTDIILGNFTAMNQMDNQMYQTYSNPPNLSFDPKLVPNMMHAWKAPINISQESYERVKRSASPVSLPKPKKMKTEHTDENENITDEVFNPQYKILLTQFPTERLKALEKMVRELGGIVSRDHKDFTHLIIPKLSRTHKLLFAVAKSCHILPEKWLEESSTLNNFLPESGFSFPTDEFNRTYNITFEKALCSGNRDKLFEGKTFWITPSVFPSKRILSELIECSGGKLERIRRSRAQIEVTNNTSPLSYFILIAQDDLHLVADLLKNKKEKDKVVCNVELVLSAVLKQEFEVEPYVVTVV